MTTCRRLPPQPTQSHVCTPWWPHTCQQSSVLLEGKFPTHQCCHACVISVHPLCKGGANSSISKCAPLCDCVPTHVLHMLVMTTRHAADATLAGSHARCVHCCCNHTAQQQESTSKASDAPLQTVNEARSDAIHKVAIEFSHCGIISHSYLPPSTF